MALLKRLICPAIANEPTTDMLLFLSSTSWFYTLSVSCTINKWMNEWMSRMVYPQQWSPISCKSSVGQKIFAGQRPMFYHCATQPTDTSSIQSCRKATKSMRCMPNSRRRLDTYLNFDGSDKLVSDGAGEPDLKRLQLERYYAVIAIRIRAAPASGTEWCGQRRRCCALIRAVAVPACAATCADHSGDSRVLLAPPHITSYHMENTEAGLQRPLFLRNRLKTTSI